ncbi:TPA: hypothetical protein ACH3X3_002436 [Trebouxia sp. C0006]
MPSDADLFCLHSCSMESGLSYKDLPPCTITELPPDAPVPACHVPLTTASPHERAPSYSPPEQDTYRQQQQQQAAKARRIEEAQAAASRAQEQARADTRAAKKALALAQHQKEVDRQQEQQRMQILQERAAMLEKRKLQAMEDRLQQERMEEQQRKAAAKNEGLRSMAAVPAMEEVPVVPTKREQVQARLAAKKGQGDGGAVAAKRAQEKYALRQAKKAGQVAPAASSATAVVRADSSDVIAEVTSADERLVDAVKAVGQDALAAAALSKAQQEASAAAAAETAAQEEAARAAAERGIDRANSSGVTPEVTSADEMLVDAVKIARQDAPAAAVAAIQQTEQQRKAATKAYSSNVTPEVTSADESPMDNVATARQDAPAAAVAAIQQTEQQRKAATKADSSDATPEVTIADQGLVGAVQIARQDASAATVAVMQQAEQDALAAAALLKAQQEASAADSAGQEQAARAAAEREAAAALVAKKRADAVAAHKKAEQETLAAAAAAKAKIEASAAAAASLLAEQAAVEREAAVAAKRQAAAAAAQVARDKAAIVLSKAEQGSGAAEEAALPISAESAGQGPDAQQASEQSAPAMRLSMSTKADLESDTELVQADFLPHGLADSLTVAKQDSTPLVDVAAVPKAPVPGEPALSDTAELVGQGPDAQQAAEEGTDAAEEAVQTNTAELVGQGPDAQQAAEESPLTTRGLRSKADLVSENELVPADFLPNGLPVLVSNNNQSFDTVADLDTAAPPEGAPATAQPVSPVSDDKVVNSNPAVLTKVELPPLQHAQEDSCSPSDAYSPAVTDSSAVGKPDAAANVDATLPKVDTAAVAGMSAQSLATSAAEDNALSPQQISHTVSRDVTDANETTEATGRVVPITTPHSNIEATGGVVPITTPAAEVQQAAQQQVLLAHPASAGKLYATSDMLLYNGRKQQDAHSLSTQPIQLSGPVVSATTSAADSLVHAALGESPTRAKPLRKEIAERPIAGDRSFPDLEVTMGPEDTIPGRVTDSKSFLAQPDDIVTSTLPPSAAIPSLENAVISPLPQPSATPSLGGSALMPGSADAGTQQPTDSDEEGLHAMPAREESLGSAHDHGLGAKQALNNNAAPNQGNSTSDKKVRSCWELFGVATTPKLVTPSTWPMGL